MALFRRRSRYPAQQPVEERPVVVERRRGPGVLTVLTSIIGWIVLIVVVAVIVIIVLL